MPMAEGPRDGPFSFNFLVWKGKISPRWITPGSSVNEMMVSRGGPGSGFIFLGLRNEESARGLLDLESGLGPVLLFDAFRFGLLP